VQERKPTSPDEPRVQQNAAVCVYFTDKEENVRYFLVGRHKNPSLKQGLGRYMFPGGEMDEKKDGSNSMKAAIRELKEETGLDLTERKHPLDDKKPINFEFEGIDNSESKNVATYSVNLGPLTEEEITALKKKVYPNSDLGVAEFVRENECNFKQKKIKKVAALPSNMEVIKKHSLHPAPMTQTHTTPVPTPTPPPPKKQIPTSNVSATPSVGAFVPTRIAYKGKLTREQAKEILERVAYYHFQLGYAKVGITYSANHDQTEKIRKTYEEGGWDTGTDGTNQAAVMREVENLLATKDYKDLQGVFAILPITTCAHSGPTGKTTGSWLKQDIDYINEFMDAKGGVVLGWQNEYTPVNSYAVGRGDIIGWDDKHCITPEQHQYVIDNLNKLEATYRLKDKQPSYEEANPKSAQSTKKPTPIETKETKKTASPSLLSPETKKLIPPPKNGTSTAAIFKTVGTPPPPPKKEVQPLPQNAKADEEAVEKKLQELIEVLTDLNKKLEMIVGKLTEIEQSLETVSSHYRPR